MSTTTVVSRVGADRVGRRSEALAARLEDNAHALVRLACALTEAEWGSRVPGDGRRAGVVVHHVASMYPLEIELARTLAAGDAIVGVTWAGVAELNASHAAQNADVTVEAAVALLEANSAAAAEALRAFTDDELDRAAGISLNGGAVLTCQFFLEDHAVRHAAHHLAILRAAFHR